MLGKSFGIFIYTILCALYISAEFNYFKLDNGHIYLYVGTSAGPAAAHGHSFVHFSGYTLIYHDYIVYVAAHKGPGTRSLVVRRRCKIFVRFGPSWSAGPA